MTRSFLRGFSLALCAAAALATTPISAAIVVSEDFESYADTAAMQANWGSTGLGTLNTSVGNPGQSASHAGGTVNSWIGSSFSLIPTATESLFLTADIFDDAANQNKRMTVGLRNGANPLFEMGHFNTPAGAHYSVRVLNMYGGVGAWVPFDATLGTGASPLVAGWNRFSATFTATELTVGLDLGANGTIDRTLTFVGAPSASPFVDLRFGGASGNSSGGGGVSFDNIRLETVAIPEPSSWACLGACLGLAVWKRRRRGAAAKAVSPSVAA